MTEAFHTFISSELETNFEHCGIPVEYILKGASTGTTINALIRQEVLKNVVIKRGFIDERKQEALFLIDDIPAVREGKPHTNDELKVNDTLIYIIGGIKQDQGKYANVYLRKKKI